MFALFVVALALGATAAAVLLVRNGEKQSVLEVREGNPVSAERAETTQPPLSSPRARARKVVYEYACATCGALGGDRMCCNECHKIAGARRESARRRSTRLT